MGSYSSTRSRTLTYDYRNGIENLLICNTKMWENSIIIKKHISQSGLRYYIFKISPATSQPVLYTNVIWNTDQHKRNSKIVKTETLPFSLGVGKPTPFVYHYNDCISLIKVIAIYRFILCSGTDINAVRENKTLLML